MPSDAPSYAPMLAGTSPDVPRGEGWAYEIKWDGFRAIAEVRDGGAEAAGDVG